MRGGSSRNDFNPRSPYGERLFHCNFWAIRRKISIHAPLTGSDSVLRSIYAPPIISIHAPLTGSDKTRAPNGQKRKISIHAPLTGSDYPISCPLHPLRISIHAPLTGSDSLLSLSKLFPQLFQSTLPLRGATTLRAWSTIHYIISIHAPLTGSDGDNSIMKSNDILFQSTLPLRGATPVCSSIVRFKSDFNPRSPYGERQHSRHRTRTANRFQSTLPLRGATDVRYFNQKARDISIHAPLTGSDPNFVDLLPANIKFQSTLPLRGATIEGVNDDLPDLFQSTLPLRGATQPENISNIDI